MKCIRCNTQTTSDDTLCRACREFFKRLALQLKVRPSLPTPAQGR